MMYRLNLLSRITRQPWVAAHLHRSVRIHLIFPSRPTLKEQALTIKQVARHLQVNESTIYKLVQKGEIPGFKVAGISRFWKEDIRAWRHKNADCPPEKGRVNKLLIELFSEEFKVKNK